MFVVIEGPDGVGKTTFSRKLAKRLKNGGYRVRKTQEPFLPLKNILEILPEMDTEELYRLFIIDRAAHVNRVISRVQDDTILISDRYWPSTWVYQGLMGVDEERIIQDNMKFPQPDLLIILTAPVEVLKQRIAVRGGKDVIEKRIELDKVVERYNKVAKIAKEELGINVVILENNGDVDEIVEDAYEKIVSIL